MHEQGAVFTCKKPTMTLVANTHVTRTRLDVLVDRSLQKNILKNLYQFIYVYSIQMAIIQIVKIRFDKKRNALIQTRCSIVTDVLGSSYTEICKVFHIVLSFNVTPHQISWCSESILLYVLISKNYTKINGFALAYDVRDYRKTSNQRTYT